MNTEHIGLGIDTGGTCTDAVLFDLARGSVLSEAKTPTTHENLESGIGTAVAKLDPVLLKKVSRVALSTTLATNACVENRGGSVKLLLIGADRRVLQKRYREFGFENLADILVIDGTPEGGYVPAVPPDWELLEKNLSFFEGAEAIGIVQAFPQRGTAIEEEARRILSEHFSVPIVCGSELFSDLNQLRRGAGTYLNIRLISLIGAFLSAVKKVLEHSGICAPVYIVRSDGTLMTEEFALTHPVDTLLCGPAASALGGAFLAGVKDAMIVDIGGTTTDVAILRKGQVETLSDGIRINGWKTFVKGMFIDTFGLGGDSRLRLSKGRVFIERYRILPAAQAAIRFPELVSRYQKLLEASFYLEDYPWEGFFLQKDVREEALQTEWEKRLVSALRGGMLLYGEALNAAGRYRFEEQILRLEREEIVVRFGLTPTDMMHVRGDFTAYDTEAAKTAVQLAEKKQEMKSGELPGLVYDAFVKKLCCELQRVFLERGVSGYEEEVPETVRNLLSELYREDQEAAVGNGLFRFAMESAVPIIGVGGPSAVFMDRAAAALRTRAVLPPHANVANAVGTLAGRIASTETFEILSVSTEGTQGYRFFAPDGAHVAEIFEEAAEEAETILRELTEQKARARGAKGEISFRSEIRKREDRVYGTDVVFGGTVTVTAEGKALEK